MRNSVIIIGGGLAGLTAAIHLAQKKFEVVLFERSEFPRHKVCGEYVSKEILPYFDSLSLNIEKLNPKEINKLQFSTKNGKLIDAQLPLGGLGLSRYKFDDFLYQKAVLNKNINVIKENVTQIKFQNQEFTVKTKSARYRSKVALGAFGKRSNIDKALKRRFISKKTHWMAIKSHYKNDDFPDNLVALHNFEGGYCGLSKTENEAVNVCYLCTYKSFKTQKSPKDFKENVLFQNPNLRSFFNNSENLFDKDLSIAQISFDKKPAVQDHILMLGDAAGLIHPLCGNGMAMAIHSAKLASEAIIECVDGQTIHREKMEKMYKQSWNDHFNSRLKMGKILQGILLKPKLTGFSQKLLSLYPNLLPKIIKKTHGRLSL